MLTVSTNKVIFTSPEEKNRSLVLSNHDPINAYLYKVKTNNLNVLEATPNCGFIRAKTSLSLMIKASTSEPFEAKLQIIYAEVGEKPNDFNTEWGSINK